MCISAKLAACFDLTTTSMPLPELKLDGLPSLLTVLVLLLLSLLSLPCRREANLLPLPLSAAVQQKIGARVNVHHAKSVANGQM